MLRFDYTNILNDAVGDGHGLTGGTIEAAIPRLEAAVEHLRTLNARKECTFLNLADVDISELKVRAQQTRDKFRDLVVIGIGGSALGARALLNACARPHERKIRVSFVDNVDPVALDDVLRSVDLETTCFNVITKSGRTIETMSSFLIVRARLLEQFGEAGYRDRVIVTTDPDDGALRKLAQQDGLFAFEVPPGVGGRFSVLCPVGLFPLACVGVDVDALLAGAKEAAQATLGDVAGDIAGVFALTQVLLYERGRGDCVFMPYSSRMRAFADWFVQLWAESLGKVHPQSGDSVGPTPIAAVGATDQHSLLQLLMEGPANKNIVFVTLADDLTDFIVPAVPDVCDGIAHLSGQSVVAIRDAEMRGVRAALAENKRPSALLTMNDSSPRTLGALTMVMECATGIAGALMGVHPYDQPGVELGKRFAHGLLGRPENATYLERYTAKHARRQSRSVTLGAKRSIGDT